jgi:P4 family phage/plasmid primase-like protien
MTASIHEEEEERRLSFVTLLDNNLTMLLNGEPGYPVALPKYILVKKDREDRLRIVKNKIFEGCNEMYYLDYVSEDNVKRITKEIVNLLYERTNVAAAAEATKEKEEAEEQQQQKKQQKQKGETDRETKVRGLTEVLERLYHFAAMEDTGELFYYNNEKGLYEPAEALVKAQVEKQFPGVITDTVTNVIQKLARRHLHKRDEFDSDLYTLNMANGLYDIRTNTLRPHSWEYLSRQRIPIKFDPKIKPKKWGKFLSEVLYPNQIRTTDEAMAYTFLRDNPFELYIILLGFGSNGKSVLMHVLTKLHGEDNVSNTSLARLLSDRFAKKDLEGKNVNLDMEMSKATIDDMSVLKELTGSQPIRVEPKFKQAYTTRLWAKHFFSTNEMPEMKDYSDAHYRRELIISFPNQFVDGVNANPNLKHELTTDEELSGIFNVLMIPLRRIAVEHKPPYMDAKTIQDRKLKHQLTTDPIKVFLETATEPTDYETDPDITKEDLHEGYKKFCMFYKIPWQRYDPFCQAVKGKGVKDGRETSGGDRKRVWKGIRLKKHLFEDPLTV